MQASDRVQNFLSQVDSAAREITHHINAVIEAAGATEPTSRQMREAASSVAGISESVTGNMQEISSSLQEQAAAMQEITALMHELDQIAAGLRAVIETHSPER